MEALGNFLAEPLPILALNATHRLERDAMEGTICA